MLSIFHLAVSISQRPTVRPWLSLFKDVKRARTRRAVMGITW